MPGRPRRRAAIAAVASLLLAGGALSSALASSAAAATVPAGAAAAAETTATAPGTHTVTLADGSVFSWNTAGDATITSKSGATKTMAMPRSAGRSGLGETYGPTQSELVPRAQDMPFELGSKSAQAASALTAPMNTGPVTLPQASKKAIQRNVAQAPAAASPASGIPANDALSSSFDSYLNAQGVDAVGAFADDAKYLNALPGAGEIVTNVSIGDLTDQSMADNGDAYVKQYGPTTVVENGQRYLDIPSLPLIPTYVADSGGTLDPAGSTENQDPTLGEVLLDFSMMAPLPDGDQRSGATGSGLGDLLGIAPGASYRLVVPQDPTYAGINTALWAAANQQPRPSVITASLGFGTDEQTGFPGRYLEDDPTIEATLAKIVKMGIPVVISANDGTRLVLPASVGPDGGATPTNVTRNPNAQTNINDDEPTTIPSEVVDDGVIAAGATTTDDTLASADISTGTYPAIRYDGSANYASGFGSRIDLSAPGDDLPSFYRQPGFGVSPQTVEVVLNGGTSAAAPEIAAAIADVLQAAKAAGTQLTPAQVRQILIETGRTVAQAPQADQPLNVGPQLDVTKAVEKVLSRKFPISAGAVRMSVAERQVLPSASGTAFTEDTDPAAIDLSGPADASGQPSGQNAVSPITFGLDMTGAQPGTSYRLQIGGHTIYSPAPYVRLLPGQILSDAGLPLTSTSDDRSVTVTMQAVRDGRIVGQQSQALTFLAGDGTYEQAQAPVLPGKAALGEPVTVSYDLTNVRNVSDPRLILSSVGHYTPSAGVDDFNVAWSTPLTALKGTVTIPASAFEAGGGGLYGVGIQTNSVSGRGGSTPIYGDFRAITVGPPASERAGVVALDGGSHAVNVTRAKPDVTVSWDVRDVPGATGAELEVGAPAPTLYNSINTVTNQNGTKPDDDGFNHPYTLVKMLPGVAGSETISLSGLGLPTSLQYPVRVIALRGRQTTGQASPTSFIQYEDGDQVAGTIEGISVTGGKALVSSDTFGGDFSLQDSATIPYDLATGTAGPDITDDTSGQTLGDVIGTDPGSGNTLILRESYGGGQDEIQVINRSGATVAETGMSQLSGIAQDASYLESAALDTQRHVAYAEVYDSAHGISDLFTVNMTTGAVSGPVAINPDNTGRTFSNISVDESTGDVFAATTGTQGPCLDGAAYMMVKIDPATGTASPATSLPACVAGVTPDGTGNELYVADGAAQPSFESGEFPVSDFFTVDQSTLTPSAAETIGTRGPAWPAYDPVSKVVVEASIYEENIDTDNNAMSEITVIDAGTGMVLERLPVANIIDSTESGTNFDFTSHQGLFLDPATRTGWLEDAWGTGLEQFHY
jgi:hypothetical protein